MKDTELTPRARRMVLVVAILSLLFDGFELGLMPVASLSVSKSLLGADFTPSLGGDWFARFTASLMLGAAVGGIALGNLGDAIGRTRALGVSVLFYSLFAGLGGWVETQQQMLYLRFLVGLGIGGVWPNAVALAAECWPDRSRPTIAGLLGAALNLGIVCLSQVTRLWPVTPASWRWLFQLAACPALLAIFILVVVPESPRWLASRAKGAGESKPNTLQPLKELFARRLRRRTWLGILLGAIPLLGAWSASKWMIPWADAEGGAINPGYKSLTQGWWSVGATLGSFLGAYVAMVLGRRRAYLFISLGATASTLAVFLLTKPLQMSFLPIVFAQGLIATLFFGWLPLYLPELFPTRVRAAGAGLAFNVGRFATAIGVFAAGALFHAFDGSYAHVGACCGLIYLLGAPAILLAPNNTTNELDDG